MKKLLIVLFATTFAMVACNKTIEVNVTPDVNNDNETLLTFKSEKPGTDISTKTAWNSGTSSIVWSTGDRIKVGYTLDGVWMAKDGAADFSSEPKVPAKFYVSNNVDIDAINPSRGSFSVPTSFSNSPSGSAVFYAVYPQSRTDTDSNYAPSLTIMLPTSQTPAVSSFDSSADIMIGCTEAIALTGSFPTDPIEINWDRIVAHADITFNNLDVDGDSEISKITLAFNEEAKVAGSFYVNVTNGTVTTNAGSSNEVSLSGTNLSLAGGSVEAWACVRPVNFTSLTVEIITDVATYTRTITGIDKSFKKNARNTLAINMASATRVLNSNLIADGNYVIAAYSESDYYAISSEANGSSLRRDRSQITTASFNPAAYSAVSPYTAANNIIWTITNVTGGVKINLAGDASKYLAYGNNTLPLGSDGATFEVSSGEGTYTLTTSGRYVSMNAANGFGCYGSGTGVHDLYVIPATGTPTLSFEETLKNVAADATFTTFAYTSIFLVSDPTVTVTTDAGNAVSSTSIADGTLTVNLNTNTTSSPKTVTLTVSATGASDVVLTITQAGVLPDASNGDTLWAEAFTGFSNNAVPAASNASTTVYGGGSVTYNVGNGGGTTKIYGSDNTAGGVAPELLIAKGSGFLTATDIPTGNATSMTLSFKSNNDNLVVSGTTEGMTITYLGKSGTTYSYSVSVPSETKKLNLTFTNNAGASTNIRIDDISLVAGAPVAGITVSTDAASSTASATGTTATINGTITLVNGAVIGDVDQAGFYYKLTSAGAYTKVTCASISSTNFSYDLTGLTKNSEYTFYAYAIYDGGSEATGETTTFTPTQSGNAPASGTTMWSETWTGATTSTSAKDEATPSANYGKGTYVYNSGSATYTESANSVYVRNENTGGGVTPELLLSSGQTWTIANIPTGGATTLDLTYVSNNTKSSVTV